MATTRTVVVEEPVEDGQVPIYNSATDTFQGGSAGGLGVALHAVRNSSQVIADQQDFIYSTVPVGPNGLTYDSETGTVTFTSSGIYQITWGYGVTDTATQCYPLLNSDAAVPHGGTGSPENQGHYWATSTFLFEASPGDTLTFRNYLGFTFTAESAHGSTPSASLCIIKVG